MGSADSEIYQIPCGRCVAKRIQCRPRGDRRFSDGQTELSAADIEKIAAANGGRSVFRTATRTPNQSPNLSQQPSIGTPSPSRRDSRHHTSQTNHKINTSMPNPISIPWPSTQLPLSTSMDVENDICISTPDLSGFEFNPSAEQNQLFANINPSVLHTTMPLFDEFASLTSHPIQTEVDLPNLDVSIFSDFSMPVGDSSFPGNFYDFHIDGSTPALLPSRTLSYDTLPSLSRDSSSDGSLGSYRRAVEEHDYVAGAEESWPAFRCNPLKSSVSCPTTSGIYLDGLFNLLKNHEAWSSWISTTHLATPIPAGRIGVESFDDVSREELTAVTQSFLSHAFDVHKARSMNGSHTKMNHSSGYMILPPAKALECFLGAYIRHFETYNICSPGSALKPNLLLHQSDANLSSLLTLLMLAYGAAADATPEARYLSSGLIEVCRISWQKVVERDAALTRDPTALLSGLLLTTLQAWSGDKTFMEVAMGQRDSYINVSQLSAPVQGLS